MVFTLWVNSAVSMLDVWRLKAAVFGPCAAGNCHAQPTGQTPLAIDRPAWISLATAPSLRHNSPAPALAGKTNQACSEVSGDTIILI